MRKHNPIPAQIDATVSQRLRLARQEAGISQEVAGSIVGLTFQQIQKYETARNRISAGVLAIFAAAYKKPIGWFFEGTECFAASTAEAILKNRPGRKRRASANAVAA